MHRLRCQYTQKCVLCQHLRCMVFYYVNNIASGDEGDLVVDLSNCVCVRVCACVCVCVCICECEYVICSID